MCTLTCTSDAQMILEHQVQQQKNMYLNDSDFAPADNSFEAGGTIFGHRCDIWMYDISICCI